MQSKINYISKKKLGTRGKYTVYLVDDYAVRNRALYAEEFSNYGMNMKQKGLATIHFPFIPHNEIWIAKSIKSYERHFIIDEALAYARGIERGLLAGEAYDMALRREQLARMRENKKEKSLSISTKLSTSVYIKKYTTIFDNLQKVRVYLVDGYKVRNIYKIDYVEGGHGYVYAWIPRDEIWIDDALDKREMPLIVLHEYIERILMKYKKFPYVKAHIIASKIEFTYRRKSLSKKEVSNLTTHAVYRLIRSNRIKLT